MANSESTGERGRAHREVQARRLRRRPRRRRQAGGAGLGRIGRIAVRGHLPVGYYKDEEKTARPSGLSTACAGRSPATTPRSRPTASITLLGRGSVCINTGGEKVFPEEVEEALKSHPEVRDAVCVGVPDARFGEAITAHGRARRGRLARREPTSSRGSRSASPTTRRPSGCSMVDTVGRSPSGKVDYKGLKRLALERLGISA